MVKEKLYRLIVYATAPLLLIAAFPVAVALLIYRIADRMEGDLIALINDVARSDGLIAKDEDDQPKL